MARTLAGLLLLVVAPAAAQEWQVAREQFVFAGTRLTIEVDVVDADGTLRLIRGEPGSVRVAGRARDGFVSSGLAEDDRLTLGAVGGGPVEFMVSVPENVWVSVLLPDRRPADNVARGRTGSWDWSHGSASSPPRRGPEPREAERPREPPTRISRSSPDRPSPEWMPMPAPGNDTPLYTTFARDRAPEEVSVPDLSTVARVEVRVQGTRFRVVTGRPLQVEAGDADRLLIQPARPPMDVVLEVPRGTPTFRLRLGNDTALMMDGPAIATLCTPVTEQRLSGDRFWLTFTPRDGALDCGPADVQRHEG